MTGLEALFFGVVAGVVAAFPCGAAFQRWYDRTEI
jgi:hypothetical protein